MVADSNNQHLMQMPEAFIGGGGVGLAQLSTSLLIFLVVFGMSGEEAAGGFTCPHTIYDLLLHRSPRLAE